MSTRQILTCDRCDSEITSTDGKGNVEGFKLELATTLRTRTFWALDLCRICKLDLDTWAGSRVKK